MIILPETLVPKSQECTVGGCRKRPIEYTPSEGEGADLWYCRDHMPLHVVHPDGTEDIPF